MKHTRFVTTILTILSATIFTLQAQDQATLRFTGQNQNGQHVTLSTVTVENVTWHWQEMLYYPDTVLTIGPVGIHDPQSEGKGVRLFQNVPNPFNGVTDFVLHLSEASAVTLEICDVNGSVTAAYTGSLDQGDNCFRAWLSSPQTYLLSARTEGGTVRIKMVNAGSAGQNRIEYLGKSSPSHMAKSDDNTKGSTNLPFSFGDWMLYQGSAHIAGTDFTSEPLLQSQNASELITLTFNLPQPTVTTEPATNITTTSAQLNGLVTENPEYPVLDRGFLITDNAQLAGTSDYTDGAGGGSFHYEVSGLQMGTRYYYRAYARTALGTTFGDILYFDTQSDLPEVHTFMVTDTAIHGAVCGGNVTYDGGSAVTTRGVCWSTTQSPTLSNIHTSDGSGVGSFTSHIFGLYANTTYYVRAYATNSVGTAYGEERSFTTLTSDTVIGPFYCGIDSVADYDGNRYPTVEIGTQCWMKENLRTTHYPDGMTIPEYPSSYDNYRRAPGDNSGSVPIYGYLYNMGAAMHGANANDSNPDGVQGICPEGWHIPSCTEFEQLMNFVGSQSQYTCNGNNISKALASTTRWKNGAGVTPPLSLCSPKMDLPSNNATGFSALPAGFFSSNFYYHDEARFFCYDSFSFFGSGLGDGGQDTEEKTFRDWGDISFNSSYSVVSVRCLLNDSGVDSSTAVLPVVSLTTLDDISASSASCTGFVTASGGSAVTARGFCWSTSPNPSVGGSHTSEGIGTGRFNSEITGLSPGTTYYLRPYATNDVGTAYGEERSFTTYWPDSCGGSTVMDFDGNIYRTIQIGTQCWLRENLRATHFADGTAIALGYNATTYATTPYRFAPWNGDNEAVPIFGYLYNRAAALHGSDTSSANPSGLQGVCPAGWHVPSAAEWHQLVDYVGSQAEYRCGDNINFVAKALASTKFWSYSDNECSVGNTPATNNASGFSALPAGSGFASNFLEESVFWITDDPSNVNVDHARLESSCSDFCGFNSISHGQNNAFSVRCISDISTMEMDSSTMVIPSVTTDTLSAISISSAICGGFVIESGSSPVSARGVCWSTSHNPTVDDSHTTTGSGTGSFKSKIDSLYANTTYYVRAYATNSVGTAYGEELSFTTLPPFYCGIDSVTDYDGNVYPTVEIGDQCWMKENLRTTHYADGTEILVGDPNLTYPMFPTTPYRCAPGNNNANVPVYGLLYNGFAACGTSLSDFYQGVCPEGWHLPNQNEYEQLIDYVGGQSQYVCGGNSIAKSLASPSGWIGTSSNTCSVKYCPDENNATGFTAVPAGANGNSLGDSCLLWTRSLILLPEIYLKSIVVVDQTVCLNSFKPNKRFLSVRCLLNESWIDSADLVVPCVTTDTSSNILSTSATCGGFVSGSGGSSVTARGVCWSTSHNPTVNDSHTSEGSGTGHFSSNISGLATGTTYYVRAYATNSVGTAYGEERSFTTETPSVAPTQ